jgi:fatty acid-binding protein DegV
MRAAGYRGGKVAISHCQNEPAARELAAIIRQDFPDAPVDILHCAALCSFYAEAGGMLVGYEDL